MTRQREVLRAVFNAQCTSREDGDVIVVEDERIPKSTPIDFFKGAKAITFGGVWSLIVQFNKQWGTFNKSAAQEDKFSMIDWTRIKDILSAPQEADFSFAQKRPIERDLEADDEFKAPEKRQKTAEDEDSSTPSDPSREFADKIEARERKTSTRLSILLCDKSFADLLKYDQSISSTSHSRPYAPDQRNAPTSAAHLHPSSSSSSTSSPSAPFNPVILVPSLSTYPINIFNVKDFCDSGKLNTTPGPKKPTKVTVTRTVKGKEITFRIVDSASAIDPRKETMVAIFLTGTSWQFKGIFIRSQPTDDPIRVLSESVGFFAVVDGREVPDQVRSWNTVPLRLSSTKDFQNVVAKNLFWDKMEAFLRSKNFV